MKSKIAYIILLILYIPGNLFAQKVTKTWYDEAKTKPNEEFTNSDMDGETVSEVNKQDHVDFFYLLAQNKGDRYKKYDYHGNLIVEVEIDHIAKDDDRYLEEKYFKDSVWVGTGKQKNEIQEYWKFYAYNDGKRYVYKERVIQYNVGDGGKKYAGALEIEHSGKLENSLYKKNISDVSDLTGFITSYENVLLDDVQQDYQAKVLGQRTQIKGVMTGTAYIYCDINGELARIVDYDKNGKAVKVVCLKSNGQRTYSITKGGKMKVYDFNGKLLSTTKIPKEMRSHKPRCYCK